MNDGYNMLQYSIYCRMCNGLDGVEKHLRRLDNNLPSKGSVRVLTITEKQYESMKLLVGKPTVNEQLDDIQLTLL